MIKDMGPQLRGLELWENLPRAQGRSAAQAGATSKSLGRVCPPPCPGPASDGPRGWRLATGVVVLLGADPVNGASDGGTTGCDGAWVGARGRLS